MEKPVCRDSWGHGPMGQPQAGHRTLAGMTESVDAAACVKPFQASLAWDGEAAMVWDGEVASAWNRKAAMVCDGEAATACQGEAALLVRVQGSCPEQRTPGRKLRLKAPSRRDGAGPRPGHEGWASGSSFPVAGLAGGSCTCKGAEAVSRMGA